MTTNIQLLRSSIAHKRPDPVMLLDGQAAVNIAPEQGSPGLYFSLTDNTLVKVGPVAFSPVSPPNEPYAGHPGNAVGEEWMDTNPSLFRPVEKIYNGSQWYASSGFLVNDENGDFTLRKTLHLRTMEANGKAQYSYIRVPQDNTDGRRLIDAQAGMFRFNDEELRLKYEGHDGKQWVEFATSSGKTYLEELEVQGDIESHGNVDLCDSCLNDFRVRGEGLFDCNVSIEKDISVKGKGSILGESVVLTTNLSDTTHARGIFLADGDSEFRRSLTVGREGSRNQFISNCPSFLLEDTKIGRGDLDKLTVEATSEFKAFSDFKSDVTIGTSISNELIVNSTAKFLGHVQLGVPAGDTNLDIWSTSTFLEDVFFQENVTIGSDAGDRLTVNSTADIRNDLTIGTQKDNTLTIYSTTTQVNDAAFNSNVTIGTDPFDELHVNSYAVFNTSVQLGTEKSESIHIKATPKFYENAVPAGNKGADLGEPDTRWGNLHSHNGSFTGKLNVHEIEVEHLFNLPTDFSVGFDELHDFTIKSTSLFEGNTGFERDVFIGDSENDILSIESTTEISGPTSIFNALYVDEEVRVNDNVVPNIHEQYTLGLDVLRWDKTFSKDADFSGTVHISTLEPLDHLLQCEDLRVVHSSHLGSDDLDDVIIDATLRQNSAAFFNDDVVVGENDSDELTVKSRAYLEADTDIGLADDPNGTALNIHSTGYFFGDAIPGQDAVVDIGTPTERWNNIYALSAYITDNIELGSNCDNDLIVHATSLFKCDTTVEGDAVLNNNGLQSTTVNGVLNAITHVNLNSNTSGVTTIAGLLDSQYDVVLNSDCTNVTTIKGELLSECKSEFQDDMLISADLAVTGDTVFNTDCNNQTLILGVLDTRCDVDLCGTNTQTATIRGDLISQVNVTLNSNCTELTRVLGKFQAECDVTLNDSCNDTTRINGLLQAMCSVELNSSCGDSTTVKGVFRSLCDVVLNTACDQTTLVQGTLSTLCDVNLNNSCDQKTQINGELHSICDVYLNTDCHGTTTILGTQKSLCNVELNTDCNDHTEIKGVLYSRCEVNLNTSCDDNTYINGVLTSLCDVVLNSDSSQSTTINGKLIANGGVVLNTDCTESTEINGVLSANCDVNLNTSCSNKTIVNGVFDALCDVNLNTRGTDTTNILGILNSLSEVNLNTRCTDNTNIRGVLHSRCDVYLNTGCEQSTNVAGVLNTSCDVNLNSSSTQYTNIEGLLHSKTDVILNSSCSNTTLVRGIFTADCDVNLNKNASNTTIIKGTLNSLSTVNLNSHKSDSTTIIGSLTTMSDVNLNDDYTQTTHIKGTLKSDHNVTLNTHCSHKTIVKGCFDSRCDVVLNSDPSQTTVINGSLQVAGGIIMNGSCDATTDIMGILNAVCDVVLNVDCDQTTTVNGKLNSKCDVTLNSSSSQTTTIKGDLKSKHNVTLNSSNTELTQVKGVLQADTDVILNAVDTDVTTVNGHFKAKNQVTLNTGCSDLTRIKGTFESHCDVTLNSDPGQTTTVKGQFIVDKDTTLNSSCADTTTIKGELKSKCNVTLNTNNTDITNVKGVLNADSDVNLNTTSTQNTIVRGGFNANQNVILNSSSSHKTTVEGALTVNNETKLNGEVRIDGNTYPKSNNSYDLGTATDRWRNIYTNDMHFSNLEGKPNKVDGTTGSWTLQEGHDNLYLINNVTGMMFKIMLEAVGPVG